MMDASILRASFLRLSFLLFFQIKVPEWMQSTSRQFSITATNACEIWTCISTETEECKNVISCWWLMIMRGPAMSNLMSNLSNMHISSGTIYIIFCSSMFLSAELYHVSIAIIHFRGLRRPNIFYLSTIAEGRWNWLKRNYERGEKKKRHTASAEPGGGHWREDWIQVIKSEPKINLFHQALHLILSLKLFSELPVYSV